MILPDRFSIMCGRTARHELATPIRFVSIVSTQAFGEVSSSGPMGPCNAAAQMRISSLP